MCRKIAIHFLVCHLYSILKIKPLKRIHQKITKIDFLIYYEYILAKPPERLCKRIKKEKLTWLYEIICCPLQPKVVCMGNNPQKALTYGAVLYILLPLSQE